MSASNKKKLRKEQAQAQMTNRQNAASKEAKKQKSMTLTFWVVMVLCVCITVGALLVNPVKNVVYRNTTAVQVGDYEVSAVELNYFYVDAITKFQQTNSSYISYLLNTSSPLGDQVQNKETGATWADYFIDQAHNNIQSTYGVYDLAMSEGFKLSEEDQSSLDNTMLYMSMYASLYGYSSVDAYLIALYGNGASEETYRSYYEKCIIAEQYYAYYADSLEYDAEALSTYQKDIPYQFNSYTYSYYYLAANRFYPEGAGTTDENNKVTYTDEETAAAVEAAQKVAEELAAGEYPDLDAFDEAINNLQVNRDEAAKKEQESDTNDTTSGDAKTTTEGDNTEGDSTEGDNTESEENNEEEEKKKLDYTSTKKEEQLYSQISAIFQDWIIGKVESETEGEDPTFETRTEGELKVIPYTTGDGEDEVINGYYVVRYGSSNDNTFAMKNVRHLLVQFVKLNDDGTPDTSTSTSTSTTYTEAEKQYAKDEAEKLLKEWQEGEATEDSFIELVKEHSDDSNASTGGLYENIYPGQMVESFEDWCYDEARKAGDVEIVETEYGYHIMYFVSDTEQTYRDYMITETMRAEDTNAWYNDLVEKTVITKLTQKFIDKDFIIG